ncbi:hypothetical protein DPMN_136108 [Dreissena polymorpha]|uniref:Uncharacterized protein n=1 Tax=Dreissena polymorpha TaxID=45954 RepID=A0A9D4FZ80_DREPO|nr:hypothetical protein DPMN_136108 [Dreissena polymorpha]
MWLGDCRAIKFNLSYLSFLPQSQENKCALCISLVLAMGRAGECHVLQRHIRLSNLQRRDHLHGYTGQVAHHWCADISSGSR